MHAACKLIQTGAGCYFTHANEMYVFGRCATIKNIEDSMQRMFALFAFVQRQFLPLHRQCIESILATSDVQSTTLENSIITTILRVQLSILRSGTVPVHVCHIYATHIFDVKNQSVILIRSEEEGPIGVDCFTSIISSFNLRKYRYD